MSRRPVVGICGPLESARFGPWEAVCVLSPRAYSLAVQRAGGMAAILPPDDAVAESPDEALDLLDALLLPGGSDLDPASYGARPHPESGATWPERDRFELALGHRALEREIPILGICRGMQMLNVICGGTLQQHLPDAVGHELHRHMPGAFGDHEVRLQPGSLAARAIGAERELVKSHHHQGLDELGEGVVASGWAEPDGIVEAVELPGRGFALGVLWHPEEDEGSRLIAALVDAARGGWRRSDEMRDAS